eukprot:scaffold30431_cov31-Tisochrysis_lutea.AAC.5
MMNCSPICVCSPLSLEREQQVTTLRERAAGALPAIKPCIHLGRIGWPVGDDAMPPRGGKRCVQPYDRVDAALSLDTPADPLHAHVWRRRREQLPSTGKCKRLEALDIHLHHVDRRAEWRLR